jgi:hypothetical protein
MISKITSYNVLWTSIDEIFLDLTPYFLIE